KMTEKDLAPVIPELLQAIKNDTTSVVRQHCVYAFFQVRDLAAVGAVEPLTAVLDETEPKHVMVRYESARCLAHGLRDKAPEKAVDVLLQMLKDKNLFVYEGSGADVTGSNVEGTKGGATVAMKLGGDARFLAAQALAQIGAKAKRRTDVLNA